MWGRAASIGNSGLELIPGAKAGEGYAGGAEGDDDEDTPAERRGERAYAEHSVAQPLDHVDHRIEQADRVPGFRKRVHRVEDSAQKRERQHDKGREKIDLFELFGPER